jgi:hypothetical protein
MQASSFSRGMAPWDRRSDESAGKRRSTKLRKSAPWLKTLLVQTAWCAVRVKGTYLRALFGRLKALAGRARPSSPSPRPSSQPLTGCSAEVLPMPTSARTTSTGSGGPALPPASLASSTNSASTSP